MQNNVDGFAAVELMRHEGKTADLVARVVFWDAVGQYNFEMIAPELPLTVVEDLIAEAKETIRVR